MGNLLLTHKHNLPISFAFDLARLGYEAWMVIGLRTAKLAMGGPAAMLEAQRISPSRKGKSSQAHTQAVSALRVSMGYSADAAVPTNCPTVGTLFLNTAPGPASRQILLD
jgi:hypothetical protein